MKPAIMGILNGTPDSFSGDGCVDHDQILERAAQMIADGADILDVGGESTNPQSKPVPQDEEIARVIPAIHSIRAAWPDILISVDTRKPAVAALALQAGADIVNDVGGDPAMADLIEDYPDAFLVIMHNSADFGVFKGAEPKDASVESVIADLSARAQGVAHDQIILDPGLGFGKTTEQNLALIRHLDRIVAMGFPVMVGPSRKSFIGGDVQDRCAGTAACVALAVAQGAHIIRVHDVGFMGKVARMAGDLWDQ